MVPVTAAVVSASHPVPLPRFFVAADQWSGAKYLDIIDSLTLASMRADGGWERAVGSGRERCKGNECRGNHFAHTRSAGLARDTHGSGGQVLMFVCTCLSVFLMHLHVSAASL
jgi:hypothetical protein